MSRSRRRIRFMCGAARITSASPAKVRAMRSCGWPRLSPTACRPRRESRRSSRSCRTQFRVPNSERYSAESGLGQAYLANSFQATYNVDGDIIEGLVIPTANKTGGGAESSINRKALSFKTAVSSIPSPTSAKTTSPPRINISGGRWRSASIDSSSLSTDTKIDSI